MSADFYHTIKEQSEGLFKERGSKFIALAYPISHENEVKPLVDELRKNHPGACHFCFAYRMGPTGQQFRANDDGEPSGSAGKPIFNQLLSFGLFDTLVVVVRYFGGSKLGVPGLINAYKEATREALTAAQVIEVLISEEFTLDFPYSLQAELEKTFKQFEVRVVEKLFSEGCFFRIAVPQSNSGAFYQYCSTIQGLKVVRV